MPGGEWNGGMQGRGLRLRNAVTASYPHLTNCVFVGNHAGNLGAGLPPGMWSWIVAEGCIDADPLFVQPPDPGPDGAWGTGRMPGLKGGQGYGTTCRPSSPRVGSMGERPAKPNRTGTIGSAVHRNRFVGGRPPARGARRARARIGFCRPACRRVTSPFPDLTRWPAGYIIGSSPWRVGNRSARNGIYEGI